MKKILLLSFIIGLISCKKKNESPQVDEVYHLTSKTVVGICDKYITTMIQDSTKLYLVGDFTGIGGVVSQSIICYNTELQKFQPYNSNVAGPVNSFLPGKTDYIGGAKFSLTGSPSEFWLASKISSSTIFEPKAMNLKPTGSFKGVSVIKKLDNEIYFAGSLNTLNGSIPAC
jgi:hypothetical protein